MYDNHAEWPTISQKWFSSIGIFTQVLATASYWKKVFASIKAPNANRKKGEEQSNSNGGYKGY